MRWSVWAVIPWPVIVLVSIGLAILAAPFIAAHDPLLTQPARQLEPPSAMHLLGTDYLGRDVFSRVLYGGRTTLTLSILATGLAVVGGIVWGVLAAASNRWLSSLMTSLIDAGLALPSLVVALVLLTVLGRGTTSLALAVGVSQMPFVARVVRNSVQSIQQKDYVLAAYSLGASWLHRAWFHVLPGIRAGLIAYALITFSYSILNAAGLSLLGLGVAPGIPEWGVMLAEGRTSFRQAPWVALAPGVMLVLLLVSLNRLADRYITINPHG